MESDINTKISQLFELLVSTQPSKKVPLQILNPLFSTINTVISLLGGDENKKYEFSPTDPKLLGYLMK